MSAPDLDTTASRLQPTLIWDLPTRLFHWALVASFALAWLTAESDEWLGVHVFCGYLMLGLIGFRLVWGLAGSHFARFANFWFSPQEALAYLNEVLRGRAARHVGHNPTGSLAIYIMLALSLALGATGILTLGAEEQQGLAAGWFSFAQGHFFKEVHEWATNLTLLVVGGHVVGVVVESVLHKENLARSMVTGLKNAAANTPPSRAKTGVAIVMLLAMLGFGGWWFDYALARQLDTPAQQQAHRAGEHHTRHVPFVGPTLADNAQWREECGSCHGVFHPSLLPARSWQKMMAEQDRHFGDDLGLDATTTANVLAFLVTNAAEGHPTEAAYKLDQSIPHNAAPQRITEVAYWIRKHRDIAAADWANPLVKAKSNCAACHTDADLGTYEDGAMQIPKRPAL